jgi:hypothetical protein
MTIKYTNISIHRSSKIYSNWYFWYENIYYLATLGTLRLEFSSAARMQQFSAANPAMNHFEFFQNISFPLFL